MKKTIVDYTRILENWIAHATKKANELNPEPIWVVKDDNTWKEYAPIKHWLFGNWALLVKKQNRTFAKAVLVYCSINNKYCSYSDYHKAYYVSLCNYTEYERLQKFYSTLYFYLLDTWVEYKNVHYTVKLD